MNNAPIKVKKYGIKFVKAGKKYIKRSHSKDITDILSNARDRRIGYDLLEFDQNGQYMLPHEIFVTNKKGDMFNFF